MRVCLLAYQIGKSLGKGLERYGAEIYERLLKKEIKVDLVSKNFIKTPILHDNLVIPFSILKKYFKIDVFHAITPRQGIYLPLLTKKRSVVTIPDIIALMEDKIGDSKNELLSTAYGKFVYNSAKNCKEIITLSEQSKKEMIENLNIEAEKINVISLGVDNRFKEYKKKNKKIFNIGYFGSLTKRKRVDMVLRSFKTFQDSYPEVRCKLEIYGSKKSLGLKSEYPTLVELKNKLKINDVYFKGFAPENKIVDIYNSFDVFVFPTVYEGFGLPIFEAQRCGVPVITIKNGKIPMEVKKETVQCIDKRNIAEKIYDLLTDEKFRNKIVNNGLKYSKKFTWERCVKETMKVYEKVER